MKAAVVRSFDSPPRFEHFELPVAHDEDELIVKIVAAGLHQRVRTSAAGKHYADKPTLPMIPGVDAVARLADGKLVYCVVHDTPFGTMAEEAIVDRRRCLPLPADANPAAIAAAMNPGMSSWLALRLRAPIEAGQSVFILGATGGAGRMAIQIAKLLGAGRVVAAGRQIERLKGLGADQVISLVGDESAVAAAIGAAAGGCDIVLDYLWARPAECAMRAIAEARKERSKGLRWVQIGAVSGPSIELPSEILRSTNIQILGSGQGSMSPKTMPEPALLRDFAGDIPSQRARVLFAVQQPFHKALTAAKTTEAAWRSKPSSYAVSSADRTINPDLQRFMAKRWGRTPSSSIQAISP